MWCFLGSNIGFRVSAGRCFANSKWPFIHNNPPLLRTRLSCLSGRLAVNGWPNFSAIISCGNPSFCDFPIPRCTSQLHLAGVSVIFSGSPVFAMPHFRCSQGQYCHLSMEYQLHIAHWLFVPGVSKFLHCIFFHQCELSVAVYICMTYGIQFPKLS